MNIEQDALWNDLTTDQKLNELRREARAQRAFTRHARRRTVLISVITAGLVALLIGRAVEVSNSNKQQFRSRTNCRLEQRSIRITIDNFDQQADGILGDNSKTDGDRNEHIKPFKLKGTPFESFGPLLRVQALGNRRRAGDYRKLVVNCDKVFPTGKLFFIR